MNQIAPYWYCWVGTRYASEVPKRPLCHCLVGVSTKFSFCVACSSWVHKTCNVISGSLKPDPIIRCERGTVLASPVDNQWQKSQWEGRRLRWYHPSATLETAYLQVAAVNSTPSQDAVSHGANSMSSCASPLPAHFPSPPEDEFTSQHKRNLGSSLIWSA